MKKINLLQLSLLLPVAAQAQERPNIVFILADDMRGSAMGFLGKENVRTPAIDAIAAEGTTFTDAHIMGGSSGAVSMPSRAMIMTGKYLCSLEKQGAVIPEDQKTLGEELRAFGYNTFHTGKWHADHQAFNRCFTSGDDIFFGGMADQWNIELYHYNEDADYGKKRPTIPNIWSSNEIEYKYGEYMLSGSHSADIFTDRAIDYINNADDSKPFYLNVAFTTPHDPRSTHQSYHDGYPAAEQELPVNFMPQHPFDNGEMVIRDEVLASIPRNPEEVQGHIRDYYANITHVDDCVARIVEVLKEKGIYDNTIIIFSADNGLGMGQHGLMGKQNVYEHSVGIPLVIKGLNSEKGKVSETPCYLIDVMPTILDRVGADIPSSVDGVSLMPAVTEGKDVRDALYYSYTELHRGVTVGDMKLIEYNVAGERHTQLFNLKEDPMEMNNLAEIGRYKGDLKRLRAKMLEQRDVVGDKGKFWDGVEF